MSGSALSSIGIDLNGITDTVASCHEKPDAKIQKNPKAAPACIILPRFPGERPLGGQAAFESLDGRGWDLGHSLPRHPVMQLLQQLESESEEVVTSAEQQTFRVGELLATHLQALSHGLSGSRVVSVPDTLTELGQQRLLDGLRHLGTSAELLWRPVAILLGWASQQPDEVIRKLDGHSVMVVHAGLWRSEVSVLELEKYEHENRLFLVPVRHGKGAGLTSSAWPIERMAKDFLEMDLSHAGLPSSLAESLLWVSRRPWSLLCGDLLTDEIVRDPNGCWHRLNGFEELRANIDDRFVFPLVELIKKVGEMHKVDHLLVEGALIDLHIGQETLGTRLAAEFRRTIGCRPEMVEIFSARACLPASGAAHYGWRRALGIVGYYDTIPDLKINALVEGRPAFVSLMEGQKRVIGGKAIDPPLEVSGFSIDTRTTAIDYYLTRADELTARKTHTVLPEQTIRAMPVTLVVTQTPGQGFASVEIRPPKGERLGDRPVFLDWTSMQDTKLTPEEVLEILRPKFRAYPDPVPFRCHAAVWKAVNAVEAMENFLFGLEKGGQAASEAAEQLMSTLGKKLSLEWLLHQTGGGGDKAGIFSSDGEIPSEGALRGRECRKINSSYQELVDKVRESTGLVFQSSLPNIHAGNKELHRRLLLIGGWCYASAPEPILVYVRKSLCTGKTIHGRYDYNVAGRCFSTQEDIALLFEISASYFEKQGLNKPFDRVKALSLVLSYRPDAPLVLNSNLANRLAAVAAVLMRSEAKKKNIKKIFFAAAYLLMGLLRYRRVDPYFLDQESPENSELVSDVKNTLKEAENYVSGNQAVQVRAVLKEITAFMEKRGTDALIFNRLNDLSE